MLSRAQRLTSSREFARAIRHGRRSGTRTMVLHLFVSASAGAALDHPGIDREPRIGFVVSRAVGGAVIRNQVKRRLRHLVRHRVMSLPSSSALVVRALPPAAEATFAQLDRDLDRALVRLLDRCPGKPDIARSPGHGGEAGGLE